jgi:transcriptional regulator with XRE-family HTH domain
VIKLLGERLLKLRKRLNLTQKQVADKLHISRATYAQYEIDRRVPEYLTLEKMADFFEVSIDHLVGRDVTKDTPPETQLDKDKKLALELIMSITDPDKKKAAMEYLRFLAGEKK